MDNFAWNGYQPPLEGATRDAFADPAFRWNRIVPDNLLEAIVTPEQFEAGTVLLRLGAAGETRWIQQWNRVRAAATSAGAIADAGEGARGY
jgi:hypothetical protein